MMLSSLFPFGYTLVAILAFALFIFGGVAGIFLGVGLKMHDDDRIGCRSILSVIVALCLVGIVLAYLYYHFVWNMICRQFTC